MIDITLRNMGTQQVAGYVGISNIILVMLFIYALAPSSGGHVNPMITLATIWTGLTPFPRGVLYLVGQTCGAALAGGLIRGSLGPSLSITYHGGGCFLEPGLVTEGQAYLIESMMSFVVV
jgi:glycerol uptake facilitator-like aquaporin